MLCLQFSCIVLLFVICFVVCVDAVFETCCCLFLVLFILLFVLLSDNVFVSNQPKCQPERKTAKLVSPDKVI